MVGHHDLQAVAAAGVAGLVIAQLFAVFAAGLAALAVVVLLAAAWWGRVRRALTGGRVEGMTPSRDGRRL